MGLDRGEVRGSVRYSVSATLDESRQSGTSQRAVDESGEFI